MTSMKRGCFTLREGVSVRGVPAAEVNSFLMQPQVHIQRVAPLIADAWIDGVATVQRFEAVHNGDGWSMRISTRIGDDIWTDGVRVPLGRHPVPTTDRDLIQCIRWLLEVRS